jgi:hypothetical protein
MAHSRILEATLEFNCIFHKRKKKDLKVPEEMDKSGRDPMYFADTRFCAAQLQ